MTSINRIGKGTGESSMLPETISSDNEEYNKPDFLMEIEGLDVTKGISLTGGTYDKYRKVLMEFHKESTEKIENIKHCLKAHDLLLFTTYIHAIKNGCWITGADALSQYAGILESAGSRNDLEFVIENTAIFLSDFEMLLDDIRRALTGIRNKAEKKPVDLETFRQCLRNFKAALSELDIRELKNVTIKLQNITYDDETDLAVSGILHKRLNGDYDGALTLTICLLENLEAIG